MAVLDVYTRKVEVVCVGQITAVEFTHDINHLMQQEAEFTGYDSRNAQAS